MPKRLTRVTVARMPWSEHVAFRDDGKTVAVLAPTGITLFDGATLRQIRRIDFDQKARVLGASADTGFVALARGRKLFVLDVMSGMETALPSAWLPKVVAEEIGSLSKDGRLLSLARQEGELMVVDVFDTQEQKLFVTRRLAVPAGTTAATLGAEGRTLEWRNAKNGVDVHDLASGSPVRLLPPGLVKSPDDSASVLVPPSGQNAWAESALVIRDERTNEERAKVYVAFDEPERAKGGTISAVFCASSDVLYVGRRTEIVAVQGFTGQVVAREEVTAASGPPSLLLSPKGDHLLAIVPSGAAFAELVLFSVTR